MPKMYTHIFANQGWQKPIFKTQPDGFSSCSWFYQSKMHF